MVEVLSQSDTRAPKRLGMLAASLWMAVGLLTILPVPVVRHARPATLGLAVAWFPLVGALVGGTVAALDWTLSLVLPRSIVGVVDLAALALLSGGLHLDGLMDTCDGIFGGRTRERRLEILRDSRVGSFGVTGAVLVLLAQYAALGELDGSTRTAALVLGAVLGRWSMGLALGVFPPARAEGLGTAFKQQLRWPAVAGATLVAVILVAVLAGWPAGLGLVVVATAVALALGWTAFRRLGGVTGDICGATGELTMVAVLVARTGGL